MQRPNLTERDLAEVDRLVALANACSRASDSLGFPSRTNTIQAAALVRSAEILGIDTGTDVDKAGEQETE